MDEIKDNIQNIRHALEEHLHSINENGAEIQALFDYVQQVELKIDKLAQRLEQAQLGEVQKPFIAPLNQMEKKVFLVLYTEGEFLTFQEMAAKAGVPEAIISDCISSLVQKGVPLQRSYFKDQLFFKLNEHFKELQAKENVVNLSLQSFM